MHEVICTYRYKGAENIPDPQSDGAKNPKKKNDRTINCIFLRTFEEPIKFQKMDDNKCPYLQERKTTIELIIIKSVDDTKLGRIALEENKKVRKALDRLDHQTETGLNYHGKL